MLAAPVSAQSSIAFESSLRVVTALACPSASLCVGIDPYGRIISGDPSSGTAGSASASVIPADEDRTGGGSPSYPTAISCPTIRFCVAVDNAGNVATSSDPTAGAGAWRLAHISSTALYNVSCPSVRLCVVTASRYLPNSTTVIGAELLSSTNPGAGAATWSVADSNPGVGPVSCATDNLCVSLGVDQVFSSRDPGRPHGTWRKVSFQGLDLVGLSCPTARFCAAVDSFGRVLSSTDPAGPARAWRITPSGLTSGEPPLTGVTCQTPKLCLATELESGTIGVSIDPGAANSWISVLLEVTRGYQGAQGFMAPAIGVTCAPVKVCVAVDSGLGTLFVLPDPGAPAARAARPQFFEASLSGVAKERPRLAFGVHVGIAPGRALKQITLALPHGVAFARLKDLLSAIVVRGPAIGNLPGNRIRLALGLHGGRLTITLAHPASSVHVTISRAAIRFSKRLIAAVRHRKAKPLVFGVRITDAGHTRTSLSLKLKAS
ncbi:MAG: hypothetical protein M3Y17_05920 [Actinomycetota bacterium]|nr:hypothetical protein [Actinomycetota bacterium]